MTKIHDSHYAFIYRTGKGEKLAAVTGGWKKEPTNRPEEKLNTQ